MDRFIGDKRRRGTRRPGPAPARPDKVRRDRRLPVRHDQVRHPRASEALQGSSRHQPSTPSPTPNRAWPGSHATAMEQDTRGNDGGFAPLEASCRRVAGVSRLYWCNSPRLVAPSTWAELDRAPLTAQFPLFGGGEVEVQGSVVPKVQTTSATNADNRVLWARQSAFWVQRCLASCVACTRIPEHAQ